jgi:hypothetical protein
MTGKKPLFKTILNTQKKMSLLTHSRATVASKEKSNYTHEFLRVLFTVRACWAKQKKEMSGTF